MSVCCGEHAAGMLSQERDVSCQPAFDPLALNPKPFGLAGMQQTEHCLRSFGEDKESRIQEASTSAAISATVVVIVVVDDDRAGPAVVVVIVVVIICKEGSMCEKVPFQIPQTVQPFFSCHVGKLTLSCKLQGIRQVTSDCNALERVKGMGAHMFRIRNCYLQQHTKQVSQ